MLFVKLEKILGRRQVVRLWVLISACVGSNPTVPAKFIDVVQGFR